MKLRAIIADDERPARQRIRTLLAWETDIEIVADRGVAAKVNAPEWEAICREMEASLRNANYGAAVVRGIEAASRLLARHFPRRAADRNELPDRPVAL